MKVLSASSSTTDTKPVTTQFVVGVALMMVAAQLGFRAWALYTSWFYTDDYRLMLDAHGSPLSWRYSWTSFDSHVMPLGRVLVWLVTEAGPLNWNLAASITLAFQLMASLACLWMLVTLFGARWVVLVPLALYLTSVLTMPALMWWAAGLNQMPFQVSFFCSVTLWVTHLRSRRLRHLFLALVSVAIGIGFYEKALILGVVLSFLALGYFASGSLRDRVVHVLRTYRAAVVAGAILAGGYLYYYLFNVPRPFESGSRGDAVADDIANSMLSTSLPTGLLGGPWRWWNTTPPIVLADPPGWAVHVAWMTLLLVVLYSALRRSRTLRGWALLATYVLCLYGVLTVSRGQIYGGLSGLEYRYLTDAVCAAALVVGLVFAEIDGAVESSAPRQEPVLTWQLPSSWAVALTALVAIGGLVSSLQYVHYWHHDNAGKEYVRNLRASLKGHQGPVDLPQQFIPGNVMPSYSEPDNSSDVFLPLLGSKARFPDTSDNLMVIDSNGEIVPALVKAATTSKPGPVSDCGWELTAGASTIPLGSKTYDWPWWLRIGYLSSQSSPITVSVGESSYVSDVTKGLGALYVRAPGVFNHVTLGGLAPGTRVCVDTVEVGDPVPARTIK